MRVWDPASSSPAPQSPERHALSGRESRARPSFLPAAPSVCPSCMVDIIFSSSFLGDMGDHSKSKSSKLVGALLRPRLFLRHRPLSYFEIKCIIYLLDFFTRHLSVAKTSSSEQHRNRPFGPSDTEIWQTTINECCGFRVFDLCSDVCREARIRHVCRMWKPDP